ncbi:MAG: uroporphyrinogen-III C-methyltransferase, partial [Candidatus Omnitrophica bacterium]|nr:uroporphyrinogen-III C-methyltransferase [Candidatus Omnitrophota bacterium]
MKKKGIVYLIGAGPGDPGLITLKGIECLKKAEVVIYDHLVNPQLLSYARKDAEIIYAGKIQNKHTLTQDEINRLLVKKASSGKCVARVKGGDPFIFGRGGEEAEALVRARINFEIVPGVTSAIAVPAYAGIPLTMRKFTSTVGFITGHEDPTKEISDIPWDKVSTGMGTLVFLMGLNNLPEIVNRLIYHGKKPETPVAVIQWGTLPKQRTVTGNLKDIAEKVKKEKLKPPSIIVVGDVVKLRNSLNWFEKRPLFGKRILVTRTREQASELSNMLKDLGADVIEFPTIEIRPISDYKKADNAISNLSQYSYLFLTSVNGVRFFKERLDALGLDSRAVAGVKVCAIGPRTAEELEKIGIKPDFIPSEYSAEGILNKIHNLKGKNILILRAVEARDT